jgi:hypothetical protein
MVGVSESYGVPSHALLGDSHARLPRTRDAVHRLLGAVESDELPACVQTATVRRCDLGLCGRVA